VHWQVVALVSTLFKTKKCDVEHVLVIVPVNTLRNWQNEFEKWFETGYSPFEVFVLSEATSSTPQRAKILEEWSETGGVLLIGYDNFRNLVNGTRVRNAEHKELFRKSLLETPGLVVCDEGHMLKNETAGITQAVMSIRTKRRIILTGTPLQNNLGEYRTMVNFVAPELLGTPSEFKKSFETPILKGQATDSSDEEVAEMRKRVHVLWEMLKCCVHRCDYSVLAKYLPPKHEFIISVRLSPLQVALYKAYLENVEKAASKEEKKPATSGISLFKAYHTLAKVCSHPGALLELEGKERDKKAYESMDDFVVSSSEEEWVSPLNKLSLNRP
jgi:transcriptional regulator ATRX